MELNKKIIFGVLLFFGFIGLTLALSELIRIDLHSDEARWMNEACNDIKAHETLRAEEDFDYVMKSISSHVHSYREESDTIVAHAVMELRELKDEAEFHNGDIGMYHEKFADVLNKLTYIELEDAIYLASHNQPEKAQGAIHRAQHYINDSMQFSKNPHKTEQKQLMNDINTLLHSTIKQENIEASLLRMRRVIS